MFEIGMFIQLLGKRYIEKEAALTFSSTLWRNAEFVQFVFPALRCGDPTRISPTVPTFDRRFLFPVLFFFFFSFFHERELLALIIFAINKAISIPLSLFFFFYNKDNSTNEELRFNYKYTIFVNDSCHDVHSHS